MNEVKELSKSQRGFLTAIRQKHSMAFESELNMAMRDIAEELGFGDQVKAGKVNFQLAGDYSRVTIIPAPAPPAPPAPPKNVTPKIPKKK